MLHALVAAQQAVNVVVATMIQGQRVDVVVLGQEQMARQGCALVARRSRHVAAMAVRTQQLDCVVVHGLVILGRLDVERCGSRVRSLAVGQLEAVHGPLKRRETPSA